MFKSSNVGGFWLQRITSKISWFLRKSDGSYNLFKPLHGIIYQDTPQDQVYKAIITYNATTREYKFEHFEGIDLTVVNASITGIIPIEDAWRLEL
jgi:hypothetical protein